VDVEIGRPEARLDNAGVLDTIVDEAADVGGPLKARDSCMPK